MLADERTNSLPALIYGDPEAIGMARDASALEYPHSPRAKATHLISLSNAKVEDLAQVINTFRERQRAGTEDRPDTANFQDIKVVADKSTNSPYYRPPGRIRSLSNIVAKLDVVRKQVFIEALIMEVSSEASFFLRHQLGHRRQHRGRRHRRRPARTGSRSSSSGATKRYHCPPARWSIGPS